MKKLFFIAAILLFVVPCWATTYYAQTQAGNGNGTDCNHAAAISTITSAGVATTTDTDTHLCGTINPCATDSGDGRCSNATGQRLVVGLDNTTITFESGAAISGYTWTPAVTSSGPGAISASNKTGVIIRGYDSTHYGTISATDNGTIALYGGSKTDGNNLHGIYINNCTNCEVKWMTIQNMYDRVANSPDCNFIGDGVYATGAIPGLLVHGNILDGMYAPLSLGFTGYTTVGVNVYNNTIRNGGVGINGGPTNSGQGADQVNIYGNNIVGQAGSDNKWSGNYSIASVSSSLNSGGSVPVGTYYYNAATKSCSVLNGIASSNTTKTTTSGNQSVTVSWTQLANMTSYRVYRSVNSNMTHSAYYDMTCSLGVCSITDDGSISWTGDVAPTIDSWVHQDGIHIFACTAGGSYPTTYVTNLSIHDNYLQDFGINSTAHIYPEGSCTISPQVYNNLMYVSSSSNYGSDGFIYIKNCPDPSIINNTMVGQGSHIGIETSTPAGHGGTIQNNIIINEAYAYLFDSALPAVCDNNLYYNIAQGAGWGAITWANWTNNGKCTSAGVPYACCSGAHAGTCSYQGYDVCSGAGCPHTADPLLVSTTGLTPDLHLQAGSPAIGIGNHAAQLSGTDYAGNPWNNPPSMGAYEGGAGGGGTSGSLTGGTCRGCTIH